jgi:hypothetical protein
LERHQDPDDSARRVHDPKEATGHRPRGERAARDGTLRLVVKSSAKPVRVEGAALFAPASPQLFAGFGQRVVTTFDSVKK